MTADELAQRIADEGGIDLDIGSGTHKVPGFIGLDMQDLPETDIVWDMATLPWPLPDGCVRHAQASHILEHVPKTIQFMGADGKFHTYNPLLAFMDEVWRVMQPGGEFLVAVPHGASGGFIQDPTHAAPLNEVTWVYFNPEHPYYQIYKPRPWRTELLSSDPAGNMAVRLTKIEG